MSMIILAALTCVGVGITVGSITDLLITIAAERRQRTGTTGRAM